MTPVTKSPKRVTYKSGANRDEVNFRYDLVPSIGLRRLAETMDEGAKKYGEGNWKKGFPIPHLLNHSVAHIFAYLEGDRSEDHLAHAAFGLFTSMHFEEKPTASFDDVSVASGYIAVKDSVTGEISVRSETTPTLHGYPLSRLRETGAGLEDISDAEAHSGVDREG